MLTVHRILHNYRLKLLSKVFFLFIISPLISAKQTIGWLESVELSPYNISIQAKIDTGADSSSLHYDSLTRYQRNDEQWVKFTIVDSSGDATLFDKKVIRMVKIKRQQAAPQDRPVILLGICIGKQYQLAEINLADRRNYKYSMLIGRDFLRQRFIVDPDIKHSTYANCELNK